MKWSFKIAEIFGISIKVHSVFVLLLVFIGWSNAISSGVAAGVSAIIFFVTIFCFVLLHELGHSIVALHYGVQVVDIVLLPIGGVARMERLPKDPKQEIAIALAGPAVNFFFVGVIFATMKATGHPIEVLGFNLSGKDFWNSLFALNAFMGLFNLIPAFPMDGGRVLRGVLAIKFPYARATRYAANAGQAIAVIFGLIGIFHNWWLILIAVFIFTGAGSEERMVHLREAINGMSVGQVMSTRVLSLASDDPLRKAVEYSYRGNQSDFPIVQAGRLVGILSKNRIMAAVNESGLETPIREVMNKRFLAARPAANLARVYEEMAAQGIESVPVIENGQILGMLSLENIGRYFAVASSLSKPGDARDSRENVI